VLLVKAAKKRGIALRYSYLRLGKRALLMSGRYAHARQMKRARRPKFDTFKDVNSALSIS
jgi:IS5 family transposase